MKCLLKINREPLLQRVVDIVVVVALKLFSTSIQITTGNMSGLFSSIAFVCNGCFIRGVWNVECTFSYRTDTNCKSFKDVDWKRNKLRLLVELALL